MNCSHSADGWCLDCVKEAHDESERLHREDRIGFHEVSAELEQLRSALKRARAYAVNRQKKHPIGLREFSEECGVSATQMSQWTADIPSGKPDIVCSR
jgi:hypothetical protein